MTINCNVSSLIAKKDPHLTLIRLLRCSDISFNQHRFSPCASWNPDGITFASIGVVSDRPYYIFINSNNTIYVTAFNFSQTLVFSMASPTPIRILASGLYKPRGMFVTSDGNIYVDNGNGLGRVERWAPNATNGVPVMNVNSSCRSLFVDTNSTLYCSLDSQHVVIKNSLPAGLVSTTVAAGTWSFGTSSTELSGPNGIFVDRNNFNMYIADSYNHRIQLFQFNQRNATTVAGSGAPGTISLNYPDTITVDADGYMFIADTANHRIVGSGPAGFRCIVGCTGQSGIFASQLNAPRSLAFDTDGNLFVTDTRNGRIQKFIMASNSCSKSRIRLEHILVFNQVRCGVQPTPTLNVCIMEPQCHHFYELHRHCSLACRRLHQFEQHHLRE